MAFDEKEHFGHREQADNRHKEINPVIQMQTPAG